MDILNFPLFHLPQNAILKVLGTMDILELILISTFSKKSTILVKSLNFECQTISAKVENDTIHFSFYLVGDELNVLDIGFEYDFTFNQKSHLIDPHYVTLSHRDFREGYPVPTLYRFSEKFGCAQWWMDHVKSSFRFAGVSALWQCESQFDILSICKTLGENLTDLCIDESVPLGDRAIILETLRTLKTLPVCEVGHVPVPIPYQVLIGNYDRSNIRKDSRIWKIDDILQMNSKEIEVIYLDFTEKELNRLLKFWMKGVWPRLEKMQFCFYEGINGEVRILDKKEMMRGIKYQNAPSERKNVYLTQQGINHHVTGGWDVWRKDGTKATVKVKYEDEEVYVSWYIWHPHCIEEEG